MLSCHTQASGYFITSTGTARILSTTDFRLSSVQGFSITFSKITIRGRRIGQFLRRRETQKKEPESLSFKSNFVITGFAFYSFLIGFAVLTSFVQYFVVKLIEMVKDARMRMKDAVVVLKHNDLSTVKWGNKEQKQ